ncbi:sugar transferase [Propionicimonas sp.]|uniref:sugar transferase n=1 Tax=Propionicimonas sp. TaxID=1955623 RepID=UPI0039E6F211
MSAINPEHGRSAHVGSSRRPRAAHTQGLFLAANDVRRSFWTRRYARRLMFTDAAIVVLTLSVAVLALRAGGTRRMDVIGFEPVSYWVAMAVFAVVWLLALNVVDSRSEHVVGHGIVEYGRVVSGTVAGFLAAVAVAFFLKADLSRSLFLIAAPVGLLLLLASRWLWRQWLRKRQSFGAYLHRTVIIGEPSKVEHIASMIRSTGGTGYEIVGAITKWAQGEHELDGLEVIGDYRRAVAAIDQVQADTVIMASADDLSPKALRHLGWAMAERDVQWIVAPAMTDVAGPRIHARPVAGLPLVHVAFPTLDGPRRLMKRAMDIVGSSLFILLLSPVMLVVALLVRLSSKGPIFYSQERIGRSGAPFGMIKFRSMIPDADAQLATLLQQQGTSDTPLFKVTDDPRITPVGRVLRKYSLDELPQLFNVLRGEMSLVGPRPQRPAEVALYDDIAQRRLLVKPGMSGLWQVSGRSALSWEDALRLDLYYIENWSPAQDIAILLRTFKAVVMPEDTAH